MKSHFKNLNSFIGIRIILRFDHEFENNVCLNLDFGSFIPRTEV